MVRAKVAGLSGTADVAAGYLDLAESLAMPRPGRLVITHGLSGSGKTTCSGELLMADPAAASLRVRADVERKRLHGLPPLAHNRSDVATGIYTRRHIVCVLPYCASCDALEELLLLNSDKFRNLNQYSIINISGIDKPNEYKNIKAIKDKIKKCEDENKKTKY